MSPSLPPFSGSNGKLYLHVQPRRCLSPSSSSECSHVPMIGSYLQKYQPSIAYTFPIHPAVKPSRNRYSNHMFHILRGAKCLKHVYWLTRLGVVLNTFVARVTHPKYILNFADNLHTNWSISFTEKAIVLFRSAFYRQSYSYLLMISLQIKVFYSLAIRWHRIVCWLCWLLVDGDCW